MLRSVRLLGTRLLPNGLGDALRQMLLFVGAYYAYRLVRGAVDGRAASAFENARELISIERSLNLFVEPSIQAWAASEQWLIDAASWMYVNSHFSITVGTLIFLYLFRNSSFYFVRNMFMVSMALALVGYMLYPTAPPRFLPEWGFEDSVAEFTGVTSDSVVANALFNPFAAVPSMHVAFALMLGIPMARLVKFRPLKWLWLSYPLIVSFVVVSTGNHFWIDAALGAAVAGLSAYAAAGMSRVRPDAWSFHRAGVGAPA